MCYACVAALRGSRCRRRTPNGNLGNQLPPISPAIRYARSNCQMSGRTDGGPVSIYLPLLVYLVLYNRHSESVNNLNSLNFTVHECNTLTPTYIFLATFCPSSALCIQAAFGSGDVPRRNQACEAIEPRRRTIERRADFYCLGGVFACL